MEEKFEASPEQLRLAGWILPASAGAGSDGSLHFKIGNPVRDGKYAEYFLRVEPGKYYRGEIQIRTKGVEKHPGAGRNRGAVLFLQWADNTRMHVKGGSFPNGLHGDNGWTTHTVPFTGKIPRTVTYLHILVGIEGQGDAWFNGLKISEITDGDWEGPEILSPAPGKPTDGRRPICSWKPMPGDGFACRMELSQDSSFPSGKTITVKENQTRPQEWLSPGKWYIRTTVSFDGQDLPRTRSRNFTVSHEAVCWPPLVEPCWSWSESPRPTLHCRWLNPQNLPVEVAAQIDGLPAELMDAAPGALQFRPSTDLRPGIHKVKIEVKSPGQKTLTTEALFSNRLPGCRVSFRDGRTMLVDGKPFFALGTYRDPSDSLLRFDGLSQAGFNLTHDYLFEHRTQNSETARKYLDAAHAAGIKVFMGLPREKVSRRDYKWIQEFVGELMDHPALLLWYVSDEPEIRGLEPSVLTNVRNAIRMVDPFHPTAVVYCKPEGFSGWADCQDIQWHDPYPLDVKPSPLSMVEDWVNAARKAVGKTSPTWTVLQAHDLRFYNTPRKKAQEKYGAPNQPSPEQTRAMAFLALSAGTDGLIWYWLPHSTYDLVNEAPKVWKGICDVIRLLKRMEPWLTAEETSADSFPCPEKFRVWSRKAGETRLIVAINASDTVAELSLDLKRFIHSSVSDFESGKGISLEREILKAEFRPWETRIFSLERSSL